MGWVGVLGEQLCFEFKASPLNLRVHSAPELLTIYTICPLLNVRKTDRDPTKAMLFSSETVKRLSPVRCGSQHPLNTRCFFVMVYLYISMPLGQVSTGFPQCGC